jgi:hypothetical protein
MVEHHPLEHVDQEVAIPLSGSGLGKGMTIYLMQDGSVVDLIWRPFIKRNPEKIAENAVLFSGSAFDPQAKWTYGINTEEVILCAGLEKTAYVHNVPKHLADKIQFWIEKHYLTTDDD